MKRTLLFLTMLLVMFSSAVWAQEKKITGRVLSSDGTELPFANIKVVGTSNGTIADENGNFTLTVSPGAQLEVSSLGFEKKTVPVGDQNTLQITLSQNVKGLNEVVITGLGVKREEKALGYSVGQVSGDAVRRANTSDPMAALQGKVAGVQITPGTGGATSSTRILIRGVNTLRKNAQPLIVVDGIPVDDAPTGAGEWGSSQDFGNQMKNINADDIESISVLKGSAATAVWGSRGLNGVVLITTKKGRANKKLGVTVSHTQQWDQVYRLPDFQNVYGMGTSSEFPIDPITQKPQMDVNAFPDGAGNFGPKMQGQEVEDYDGRIFKFLPFDVMDLYETGRYINTNVAIDGGNETTTFRFSYSNNYNSGITYNNTFKRNSLNLRLTQRLGKVADVDAGVNFTRSDAMNPARDGGNDNFLFSSVYYVPRSFDFNYYNTHYIDSAQGGILTGSPWGMVNTLYSLYMNNVEQLEDNLLTHINITAHAASWLDFKLNGFLNNYYTNYESMQAGTGPNFGGGSYTLTKETKTNYRLQGLAVATKKVNDWNLGLTLGVENNTFLDQYVTGQTNGGLIIPLKYTLQNSVQPTTASGGIRGKSKLNSAYAFADIGWKDMLFLSLTGRNDWNSTLTYADNHGKNSYFFPSASVSWVFTETFKLPSFFTFGKLRASYAIVGSGPDPYTNNNNLYYTFSQNYRSYGSYSSPASVSFPVYGFQSNTLGNVNLKPELSHSMEFGTNLKFFDNRLGLDFTYYKNNVRNQILNLQAAAESGISGIAINAGNIQNQGIELVLTGTPVQTKDFSWDIMANLTRNRNLIVELAPGVTTYDLENGQGLDLINRAVVGKVYGEIYTKYAFARYQQLDDKGQPVADPRNGMKVLSPVTDAGATFAIYTRSQDYQNQGYLPIGNSQPKFLYGFRNDLSWKGLHLGISLDGRVGGIITSATYGYGVSGGDWKSTLFGRDKEHGGLERKTFDQNGNVTATYNDGIIPEGVFAQDAEIADPKGQVQQIGGMTYQEVVDKGWIQPVPAWQYYANLGTWATGIREIEALKEDWLAVREISIGYDLPTSWLKKIKLNSARISVVGRNVGYLYNAMPDHIFPEGMYNTNASNAFEYGGLPFVRNIGFNVQLGL